MKLAQAALTCLLVVGVAEGACAEELSGYNGEGLYRRFCASCHGTHGHGDGPVADSLKTMVPDITLLARRHGGTFPAEQVHKIIDGRSVRSPHGARDMPVWGFEFRASSPPPADDAQADALISQLVEYLRLLQH